MTTRLLLCDDHQLVREGLRTLLSQQTNMEVVAEASNGREAVELAKALQPNVVLLDISMADMNGTEACLRITAECPGTRVIALSVHSDRRYVLGMLRSGASGYLVKSCAFQELTTAIETVCRGESYLCSAVTSLVIEDARHRHVEPPATSVLTSREREVLQLIAEGVSTKVIAARLGVSIKTAESHRAQIMLKLEIHTVAELTKYAIREGLTTL